MYGNIKKHKTQEDKTMKKMKLISLLLAAVTAFYALSTAAFAADENALQFGTDGKFKVLQLTDPQDDRYIAHELKRYLEAVLETEKPDLVVFTGDIVEDSRAGDIATDDEPFKEGVTVENIKGELDYAATLANVSAAAKAIFEPVEKAGIPFAVTMGNNDYNSGISTEDWLKIFAEYPHYITVDESRDEDGRIDSYVEINKHNSNEVGYGLWLLDNGRGFSGGQAEWFKQRQTGGEPSIVFEHSPVDEVGNLFKECKIWDEGALLNGGKPYCLNPEIASGVFYAPYSPGRTSEQFIAWKAKGVVGAFFGHIHTDGYTGVWDSITLGLTYGCQFAKAGPYGYRTITLDENGSFDTELYIYNKGTITLQEDEKPTEYASRLEEILGKAANVFMFIYRTVAGVLKF